MPNTFTTITQQGFGSRIMGAIVGVPIGILLILGACILLYWNEGRVDFSKIASKSIAIPASQINPTYNGKFVSITGNVTANQQLGDGAYLKPGPYVAVQRTVEEYSWAEQQHSQSNNHVGGSSTTTTTYTYTAQWSSSPQDSSTFNNPQGHQNPPMPISGTTLEANSGKIGAYQFDPQTIKLPPLQPLSLNASIINLGNATTPTGAPSAATNASNKTISTAYDTNSSTPQSQSANMNPLSHLTLASAQYIYGGSGSLSTPKIGDIRISYQALENGTTVTAFGQLSDGSLGAYTDSSNHTLYSLLLGDRQTAIATLHTQYITAIWIFRGVGIAMIWFGLMMLFAPLDAVLDFIPIAGEIGGVLSFIISFPIALILGGSVILIGYTMHHIIALIIGVPVVLAICIGLLKLMKKLRGIPRRGSNGGALGAAPIAPSGPIQPSVQSNGSLFPKPNQSTTEVSVLCCRPPVRSYSHRTSRKGYFEFIGVSLARARLLLRYHQIIAATMITPNTTLMGVEDFDTDCQLPARALPR